MLRRELDMSGFYKGGAEPNKTGVVGERSGAWSFVLADDERYTTQNQD